MNYTDKIYENYEVIEQFENKYKVKLSNRTRLTALLSLESMLKSNQIAEIEKIANDIKDVNHAIAKDLLDYAVSNKTEKPLVIQTIELVQQYKNSVAEYIDIKGYSLTMKDLSEILDADEDYITRNLMHCFDYFKIKTMTRCALKIYKYPYSLDFINKNVFFSRKSVKEFLLKYLKYSFDKVQVDLTMPSDKHINLMAKFKTDTTYRRAIRQALDEINVSTKDIKSKKAEAKIRGERFTRMDLKLFNISEEIADSIMAGDIKIQSIDTIRNKIVTLENIENEMTDNENRSLISLNDTQLYKIVDNRLSSIRFSIDGLTTYNKQLGTEQRKIMVRYTVKIKDIVMFRQDDDNYLYSIEKEAYKKLIKDTKTEEERQSKIINYFYNKLMNPHFVVKNKKDN